MNKKILVPLAAAAVLLGTGAASAQMFGGGFGLPGAGRMSGTVTIEIYRGDPAVGAQPIETLTLNRPLSPGEIVANYEGAAFVVISGDDFSRTVDLSELAITVQIYQADPAEGGEPIVDATLPDMSGLRALIADTDGAAFVVVTGDDFTRTLDLSRFEVAAEPVGERVGPGGLDERRGPRGPGGFGPRHR